VAWNMGEWREFARLRHFAATYRTILLATFFLTVVFDLTVAVEVGLVLSSLFFIYRMSDLTRIERLPLEDFYGVEALARPDGTPRILAYRLTGSLFFGAANKLENLLLMQDGHPDAVILDLEKVISIDTTGLDILQTLQRNLTRRGATLILCDLNEQPGSLIRRSGFADRLGEENIAGNITDALLRAQTVRPRAPAVAYA